MKKYWKKKIDERQEADLRRVESYGYWIAFWLLLASVLMKSVILSRPRTEWFTAGSWLQSGKTMEWDRILMLFISWLIGLFAVLFATFLVLMWVYRARDRRMQKKMDEELEEDDDEEL